MGAIFGYIEEIFFSGPGINVSYSSMHMIMPIIVICILLVLALVMLIQHIVKCVKNKKSFITFKDYHFFAKGFSPVVFLGSIAIMVLYFWLMPKLHFVVTSILALFVLNMLYARPIRREDGAVVVQWKPIAISGVISVVGPVLIWVLFGMFFGLTLP